MTEALCQYKRDKPSVRHELPARFNYSVGCDLGTQLDVAAGVKRQLVSVPLEPSLDGSLDVL